MVTSIFNDKMNDFNVENERTTRHARPSAFDSNTHRILRVATDSEY